MSSLENRSRTGKVESSASTKNRKRRTRQRRQATAARQHNANIRSKSSEPAISESTNQPKSPILPQQALAESQDGATCLVCANITDEWAFGECGHVICGSCTHRMRVLYKDTSCVICKTDSPSVIVVPLNKYDDKLSYAQTVQRFDRLYTDSATRMQFVDSDRMHYYQRLRRPICPSCESEGKKESALYSNMHQLRTHVEKQHQAVFCDICLTHAKRYTREMPMFPLDPQKRWSTALRKHMRTTHPMCQFCKRNFFDDDMLYAHLVQKHETCPICTRAGRQHEYYRNFTELEHHYRDEHFVCEDPGCRGQVFATVLDLQAHQMRAHGNSGGGVSQGNSRTRFTVNVSELHNQQVGRRGRRVINEEDGRREFSAENVVFSGAEGVAISRSRDSNDTRSFEGSSVGRRDRIMGTRGRSTGTSNRGRNSDFRRGGSAASARTGNYSHESTGTTSSGRASSSAETRNTSQSRAESNAENSEYHSLSLPEGDEERTVRNQLLARTLRSHLDPASYELFQKAHTDYRKGMLSPKKFYDSIVDVFGVRTARSKILPELIALLPSEALRFALEREVTFQLGGRGPSQVPPAYARESAFPSLSNGTSERGRRPLAINRPNPFMAPRTEDFPSLPSASSKKKASTGTPQRSGQKSVPSMRQIFGSSSRSTTPSSAHAGQQQNGGFSAKGRTATSAAPSFPALPQRPTSHVPPRANGEASRKGSYGSWAPQSKVSKEEEERQARAALAAAPIRPAPASSPASAFPPLARSRPDGATEILTLGRGRKQGSGLNLKRDLNKSGRTSLPKIGGSGFGFAWDRQKLRSYKRQVRNGNKNSDDKGEPKEMTKEGSDAEKDEDIPTEDTKDAGGETTETASREGLPENKESNLEQPRRGPKVSTESSLDELGYLKDGESVSDQAAASFFGS